MAEHTIDVEVSYALPDRQIILALRLPMPVTLEQAVRQSGILQQVPEIDLTQCRVGIYAKLKTLETVLRQHDRVEIYRPLIADPKDARRRRAELKAQISP